MFLVNSLCCFSPKSSRRSSSKNQQDDIIPAITQQPPRIHISSPSESQLAVPLPAFSENVAVYPPYSAVRRPAKRPFKSLPLDVKVEEETNPGYRAETWYHVRIGEVIKERYQICTKIGWGDTSTVWLANDLRFGISIMTSWGYNTLI